MKTIKIIVFDVNHKELYRNTVEVPQPVCFPFEAAIDLLKLFYPKSSTIQFSICSYDK